jgi:prepilin-type N-terminal cleavage/methylation domain-containing protein
MLKKMCKKGFTLVELMIVIAIVSILIAVLIPAIAKFKQDNVQIEQTIEIEQNENSGDKKL